ncbi:hypothetical protein [Frankia sp. AgW1.1]|uniref:hypothetical protein n=1 Tax=Frankia sp. AgW1.1 TaxID=1836971 RepID=UPI00193207A3|nr:hypothetical protein [Frankia sp. AgW1.1]MBL7487037.1 hypothetical protein [Frankia sp. AgW1.1]
MNLIGAQTMSLAEQLDAATHPAERGGYVICADGGPPSELGPAAWTRHTYDQVSLPSGAVRCTCEIYGDRLVDETVMDVVYEVHRCVLPADAEDLLCEACRLACQVIVDQVGQDPEAAHQAPVEQVGLAVAATYRRPDAPPWPGGR